MTHKALELVGEKVTLITLLSQEDVAQKRFRKAFGDIIGMPVFKGGQFDTLQTESERAGIFWPSPENKGMLDFIHPIYHASEAIQRYARGHNPRKSIHEQNPILSLYCEILYEELEYEKREEEHTFTGPLHYIRGAFCNDANWETYDTYRKPLQKAGFKIV